MGKGGVTSVSAFMRSFASFCAFDSKYARGLLVFSIVWTYFASPVASNDVRSTAVAYPLVPNSGRFGPDERPALWQLPEGPVEKVLVIFSGRNDHPSSYWDYSPSCLECIGSPDKRQLVADALSRNYAVFMPDEVNSEWGAWPEDNPDVHSVQASITEWKNLQGLHGLPTMAIGISAGGWILSTVALRPGFFDAICLMVSAGKDEAIEASTSEYPPTMIVHMPRDTRIAPRVTTTRRTLESKGVPTAELKWYPQPLTRDWFSKSIIGVDEELSRLIFVCIKGGGWLDEANFIASEEYETEFSSNTVQRCNLDIPGDLLEEVFEKAVVDEMKVAYAYHCIISRLNEEIFAFFDGAYHSGTDLFHHSKILIFASTSHLPS